MLHSWENSVTKKNFNNWSWLCVQWQNINLIRYERVPMPKFHVAFIATCMSYRLGYTQKQTKPERLHCKYKCSNFEH